MHTSFGGVSKYCIDCRRISRHRRRSDLWVALQPVRGAGALAGDYVGVSGDIGIGSCPMQRRMSAFGPKRTKSGFWAGAVCPLMTHLRHRCSIDTPNSRP